MKINEVIDFLSSYNGRPLRLMEVCGTHTSSIFKNGIRSILSPNIRLVSGPGCPVCVTPTAYIDRCIALAKKENYTLLTFGDMMKVPGTHGSLTDAAADGAHVLLMYSPMEALALAKLHPNTVFVVAAVGFETTAPAYALLAKQAIEAGLSNVLLITSIKTVPPALHWLCQNEPEIDGFLAPGHVAVIIGSEAFAPLAQQYKKPFAVAGFEAEHILLGVYDLIRQSEQGIYETHNFYPSAVKPEGNPYARSIMDECFEAGCSMWRGLGKIDGSGLYLKGSYASLDAGSMNLDYDAAMPSGCACTNVIVGRTNPAHCPLFGKLCSPEHPVGPCMVSAEGACGIWYRNRRNFE